MGSKAQIHGTSLRPACAEATAGYGPAGEPRSRLARRSRRPGHV